MLIVDFPGDRFLSLLLLFWLSVPQEIVILSPLLSFWLSAPQKIVFCLVFCFRYRCLSPRRWFLEFSASIVIICFSDNHFFCLLLIYVPRHDLLLFFFLLSIFQEKFFLSVICYYFLIWSPEDRFLVLYWSSSPQYETSPTTCFIFTRVNCNMSVVNTTEGLLIIALS